jgi:hypothetical protein
MQWRRRHCWRCETCPEFSGSFEQIFFGRCACKSASLPKTPAAEQKGQWACKLWAEPICFILCIQSVRPSRPAELRMARGPCPMMRTQRLIAAPVSRVEVQSVGKPEQNRITSLYCITPNLWKKVTRYPAILFSHWNTWGCIDSLAYKLPASIS